jgi:hypothetical protein
MKFQVLEAKKVARDDGPKNPRIHFWLEGATLEEEPYQEVREQAIPGVLAMFQVDSEKVGWSQRAGCSCGCSPGFILRDVEERFDIFLTIEVLANKRVDITQKGVCDAIC